VCYDAHLEDFVMSYLQRIGTATLLAATIISTPPYAQPLFGPEILKTREAAMRKRNALGPPPAAMAAFAKSWRRE
jgi:hypothetical protein